MRSAEFPKNKENLNKFLELDSSIFSKRHLVSEVIGVMNGIEILLTEAGLNPIYQDEDMIIYKSETPTRVSEIRRPNSTTFLHIDDEFNRENSCGIRIEEGEKKEVFPFDGIEEAGIYLSIMQDIVRDNIE
jgi:hypothetical protein